LNIDKKEKGFSPYKEKMAECPVVELEFESTPLCLGARAHAYCSSIETLLGTPFSYIFELGIIARQVIYLRLLKDQKLVWIFLKKETFAKNTVDINRKIQHSYMIVRTQFKRVFLYKCRIS